jgi:hypothetical protein
VAVPATPPSSRASWASRPSWDVAMPPTRWRKAGDQRWMVAPFKKNTGMDDIDYMWWYLLMVGGISWD